MEQKTKILTRMASYFLHRVHYKDNVWTVINEKNSRYSDMFFVYSGWIEDMKKTYPDSSLEINYKYKTMTIKLVK